MSQSESLDTEKLQKELEQDLLELTQLGNLTIHENLIRMEEVLLPFMVEKGIRSTEEIQLGPEADNVKSQNEIASQIMVPKSIILNNVQHPKHYSGQVVIRNLGACSYVFKIEKTLPKNNNDQGPQLQIVPEYGFLSAHSDETFRVQTMVTFPEMDKFDTSIIVWIRNIKHSDLSHAGLKEHWKNIESKFPDEILKFEIQRIVLENTFTRFLKNPTRIEEKQNKEHRDTENVQESVSNTLGVFLNKSAIQIRRDIKEIKMGTDELLNWGSVTMYISILATIVAVGLMSYNSFLNIPIQEPEPEGWWLSMYSSIKRIFV